MCVCGCGCVGVCACEREGWVKVGKESSKGEGGKARGTEGECVKEREGEKDRRGLKEGGEGLIP